MTRSEARWRRHHIPTLGLSVDVNPEWPLDTLELEDGTIVSQRLPDDGAVVFVRYGPGQTLDRFLPGLGDMLTTATVGADVPTHVAGLPARRVTVSLHRRPVPERSARAPSRLQVTGFTVRGTPVLVGYRVREDRVAESWAALERIVGSVEVDEDAGTEHGGAPRSNTGDARQR